MSDIIKFGGTQIGTIAILRNTDYSEGQIIYTVEADYQAGSAKSFLAYVKNLFSTIGVDDVQAVSIPRATGVRIYADVTMQTLTVNDVSYGSVACRSAKIGAYHPSGYGTFELEFIGSQ